MNSETMWTEEDQNAFDDGVHFGFMREKYYPEACAGIEKEMVGDISNNMRCYVETSQEYIALLEEHIALLRGIIALPKLGN